MIRTFLFDMGNVLVYFSHEKMYQQIGALYNLSEDETRSLLVDSNLQKQYERGELTDTQFHHKLEQQTNCKADITELRQATSDIFILNHEILPLLDLLKTEGYRLIILSNTCSAHITFIQKQWQLLDKFDDSILSYKVQALKPEPKIYKAVLQIIDCKPHEAFFIDDIPQNITQARQHGLQGVTFTGTASLIKTLREEQKIALPDDFLT
ncbi:hypothetical protein MNBD_PLANCTO02-2484 [hydrothermal vent metagenome]|uniref:Uncharacterized protein n=1 Tax=hydrothermal vent metagenome TaxID=652676 RepID=A0A3B1DGI5_9ZZZZ